MAQTISNYKSELDQFTLILKKLEQSLLSTRKKLKKEIEKNESLNQDILKLKEELPSYDNSKDKELQLALKQLKISQNQSLLFKEELDRTIEKLNEKIAENHHLDIINKSLQQKKDADFSYPSLEDTSIENSRVQIPAKLHTVSDKEKIQELKEKLRQQEKENKYLQKQLSQADSHIFSKEEVTELFLQEKIFAKELENKEKEKRQEEYKTSFNREEEQLYDELLSISKANQDFISRLSKLKDKKKKIKSIEEQKND